MTTNAARDPLALVDDEFRRATPVSAGGPVRLFVNLSERCQLRCAHCITDAPARTKDGRARDMTQEVLDALAPHLARVSWVGLVHAGEPMLAPLFEPFLEALQRARAAPRAVVPPSVGATTATTPPMEPAPRCVVHLLTNGMAMTLERFARVQALGVSSLSVSLDGMSASTNDVLRIGASARVLVERIEALAKARAPGTRIGVSWVVTSANIGELEELVRFAARAKLDWLKLEEIFPLNDTARALVVDRYALDVAVANARALGDELAVPVLDHTRPLEVWRCRFDVDRRMARRARLDDLVNRAELNPCRAPWEVACIEPNGDVRPLSFHHPVAGNVLERPLDAIFRDAPAFVDARATSRVTRLCGAGPTTCAPDPGPGAW